jgi:hypothetical protein
MPAALQLARWARPYLSGPERRLQIYFDITMLRAATGFRLDVYQRQP